jgi:hypothetical protein
MIALDQIEGKSASREIRDLQNIERELLKFDKATKTGANAMLQFKDTMKGALDSMSQGFQTAIQAWIMGEKSLGDALAESAKQAIAALAAKAAQEALWDVAKGLVALATGDGEAAGQYFAAAEIMGIIALAAGAAAKGAYGSGGGKGAGGGSNNANIDTSKTENKPVSAPTSGVNVQRLFSGAIVTQPTYAMVGDNAHGGRATEGVFPLDDPRAAQAIRRLFGGDGAGVVNNFHVRGMLSTQDLAKTARVITRGAQTGRLRVSVSNSGRVIKRS